MSEYFSNFPRILYDVNGTNPISPDHTVAINIMVRQKIRDAIADDVTLYYPYIIDGDTRPDILSHQIYGDIAYTWTIFYVNNMLDPYWNWPLTELQLTKYLNSKYGSVNAAKTTVHHYEQITDARVEVTGTADPIPERTVEVDYTTYRTIAEDFRKVIYVYEYEQEKNEEKRSISLINPSYVTSIMEQFRGMFR